MKFFLNLTNISNVKSVCIIYFFFFIFVSLFIKPIPEQPAWQRVWSMQPGVHAQGYPQEAHSNTRQSIKVCTISFIGFTWNRSLYNRLTDLLSYLTACRRMLLTISHLRRITFKASPVHRWAGDNCLKTRKINTTIFWVLQCINSFLF